VFNQRHSGDLGDADALKVFEEVRATVVDGNDDLAAQASANSKDDFVRHRDDLLISAAMEVTGGREKQAGLLKALLDDDELRARAGKLVMGSIYDAYREGAASPDHPAS